MVAAYGTLRVDQGNYNWALKNKSDYLGQDRIKDFDLIAGTGFPYAVENNDSEGNILLDVFMVDANVMKSLDSLEGYPSFYNRKQVSTKFGKAWVYFYNRAKGGEIIANGDWVDHIDSRYERRRIS